MEDRYNEFRPITPKKQEVPLNLQEGFHQYLSAKSYKHKYQDNKEKVDFNNFKSFYLGGDNSYKRSFGCQYFLSPFSEEGKKEKQNKEENNEEINYKESNTKTISKLNIGKRYQDQANDKFNKTQNQNKNEVEKIINNDFGYKTFNNFLPKNIQRNLSLSENKQKFMNLINLNLNKKTNENFLLNNNDNNNKAYLYSKKFNLSLKENIKENMKSKIANKFDVKNKNFSNINLLNPSSNFKSKSKSKDFLKTKNNSENFHITKPEDFGFKSYEVPRNESKIIDFKKPMNILAKSIGKSLSGTNGLSNQNAYSPEKLSECKEENMKLIKIIDKQTNNRFLKFTNLPDISNLLNPHKRKMIKNPEVQKIKHMGDRYNPYNFQAGRDCESNRRNFVGGLFSH
jgi:hypothetical protein